MAPQRIGDLQFAILEVLWQRGEAVVAEVHADLLIERGLATTTIATMLRKMEDRGLVISRKEGRALSYRPAVSREAISRTMVGELLSRLFAGDPRELVQHLVREGELDASALDDLRRQIARKKSAGEGTRDDR